MNSNRPTERPKERSDKTHQGQLDLTPLPPRQEVWIDERGFWLSEDDVAERRELRRLNVKLD